MERLFGQDAPDPSVQDPGPITNLGDDSSTHVDHDHSTRSQGRVPEVPLPSHRSRRKRVAPGPEDWQNEQGSIVTKRRATNVSAFVSDLHGSRPPTDDTQMNTDVSTSRSNAAVATIATRNNLEQLRGADWAKNAAAQPMLESRITSTALPESFGSAPAEDEAASSQWYRGVNPSPLRSVGHEGQPSGLVQRTARRGRGGAHFSVTTARHRSVGSGRQGSESSISSSESESSNASLYCA